MGIFKKTFGTKPNLTKLLSAHIITDEDHRYFISFSKYHPQLQLAEFIRLVLYYYAKILFNFDPADPQMSAAALLLKKTIQSLLDKGIHKDSNILKDANIDDVVMMVSSPQWFLPRNKPREIVATLFFVDTTKEQLILTDIPKNVYIQHLVFSVMVLLQAVLEKLDQECIDVLNRSLSNMNKHYDSGESYSDIQNLATIPTIAYWSSIPKGKQEEQQRKTEEIR